MKEIKKIEIKRFYSYLLILLLCRFVTLSFASFEMHPASVLLFGRGGWSLADEAGASMENCAAFSKKLNWEAGGANFYGISSLNEYFFLLNVPSRAGGFNFIHSALKFSSVYQESIYSVGFNRALTEKFVAGLRLNLFQLQIEKFEMGMNSNALYTDYGFGFLYREKFFNLGFSALSVSSNKITVKKISDETEPRLCFGLMLKPAKTAKIGIDWERNEPVMAGIEVEVAGALKSAIGIRKNIFTMGFSLRMPVFWLNFSTSMHSELGKTYFISISND